MIGLDTNVLVRFFMQDDWDQCARVDSLMQSLTAEAPGWVGIATLMELVWVLTSTYRQTHRSILRVLDALVSSEEVVLDQADVVREAIENYRNFKIGFADCLIACTSRAAGCEATFTFDRNAAKKLGMKIVP
jgi:predicted nucleic-acid-binding protein